MLDFLTATAAHAGEEHAAPGAFGVEALGPGFFVALAMLVVFAIMLKAGVPKMIAGMLDARIGEIRKQLDEAKALRAEAEKLRDEYARKAADAENDIAAMRASAERNASEIVEKAKADAAALIARHKASASEKIAAAERSAIADLRTQAAAAAATAARQLIAEKHGETADRKLADEIIAGI
ncbi:F0F1 ATP synthase subunit B family protein [Tsuneonella sp. HG249]